MKSCKLAEAKVWSFVVDLRTNFLCVLTIVCFPRECEEYQYYAVLGQGIYLFAGSGPVALGPAKHWPRTLADQLPAR